MPILKLCKFKEEIISESEREILKVIYQPKYTIRPGENILASWKMEKLVRSTATWTTGSTTSVALVKPSGFSATAADESQEAAAVTTGGQSTSMHTAAVDFLTKFGVFIMVSLKRNNINKQTKQQKRTIL